jgi:hypothetical protein
MTWWAVDVQADPADREAVAGWLVNLTGQAVEERLDGTVVSFAPDDAQAGGSVRGSLSSSGPSTIPTGPPGGGTDSVPGGSAE